MGQLQRSVGGLKPWFLRNGEAFLRGALVAVACLVVCLSITGTAHAQVVLPDFGIDVDELIEAFATYMGAIVLAVLGVFLVVLAVKRFMRWMRASA